MSGTPLPEDDGPDVEVIQVNAARCSNVLRSSSFYNDGNNNGMPGPEGGFDGRDENKVGFPFWGS
jgi:hypothetical protein